jgi:23S rRNA pseudouridine955/2504/2580 synthase/23S rRNA pseudouridine1911/1915/1917 synthase
VKIDIIYKDEYIVIINKSAGMLTVADRLNIENVHLQSLLRLKYGEIFTIHRLDRDTSGAIIFAKDAESHKILSEQFETRDVQKHYLAIVDGTPPEYGLIDEPLAESQTKRGVMKVYKKGKPSLTEYNVVKQFGRCSLIAVLIHTGRMHQIRVHMAHIGHPLFVDAVYGRREAFYLSELKGRKFKLRKLEEEERPHISRQTLHSHILKIHYPKTGEKMSFEATVPKDMAALIKQLEKKG